MAPTPVTVEARRVRLTLDARSHCVAALATCGLVLCTIVVLCHIRGLRKAHPLHACAKPILCTGRIIVFNAFNAFCKSGRVLVCYLNVIHCRYCPSSYSATVLRPWS
jgi:hypothetical protein